MAKLSTDTIDYKGIGKIKTTTHYLRSEPLRKFCLKIEKKSLKFKVPFVNGVDIRENEKYMLIYECEEEKLFDSLNKVFYFISNSNKTVVRKIAINVGNRDIFANGWRGHGDASKNILALTFMVYEEVTRVIGDEQSVVFQRLDGWEIKEPCDRTYKIIEYTKDAENFLIGVAASMQAMMQKVQHAFSDTDKINHMISQNIKLIG